MIFYQRTDGGPLLVLLFTIYRHWNIFKDNCLQISTVCITTFVLLQLPPTSTASDPRFRDHSSLHSCRNCVLPVHKSVHISVQIGLMHKTVHTGYTEMCISCVCTKMCIIKCTKNVPIWYIKLCTYQVWNFLYIYLFIINISIIFSLSSAVSVIFENIFTFQYTSGTQICFGLCLIALPARWRACSGSYQVLLNLLQSPGYTHSEWLHDALWFN